MKRIGLDLFFLSVGALVSLSGCQAVLGLGNETDLPDAAPDVRQDAHSDAPEGLEAGRPPEGGAALVASSLEGSYWCAVTVNGDVECWGDNESGELGNGSTQPSNTPVKVEGLPEPAIAVSMGVGTPCALTKSGGVFCWGIGGDGELGNGSMAPFSDVAVPVSHLQSGVTSMSSGNGVACAVKAGALSCWGFAGSELLGTRASADTPVPVSVPTLATGVSSVSLGFNVACAVRDGVAYCWGAFDGQGELGNNTTVGSYVPVAVHGLTNVTAVSAGGDFACAITEGGAVWCWGDGTRGQLGNAQLASSPVPVPVAGLSSGVVAVSAGYESATALRADGSVVSWGYAADGELGNGSSESNDCAGGTGGVSPNPVSVGRLSGPAVSISTGGAPCVATTGGSVECWGVVAENALAPVPVTGLASMTSITTGGDLTTDLFACGVSSKGFISCWGGNTYGQLGAGLTLSSTTLPVRNSLLVDEATVVEGSKGGNFACGVASGLAYCWGDNSSGQLGNGKTLASNVPVGVSGLTGAVTSVAAGLDWACAITSAGSDAGEGGALYCWGDNTFGQLGNGSNESSLEPVLAIAGGVNAVALGDYSSCALMADSTVDCWGNNETGQLGDGTQVTRSVPKPVHALSNATAISVGDLTACAVTNGSVVCWGDDTFGELGDADETYTGRSVPVSVVNASSGATQVSVGQSSACAVVAGAALCWGMGPLGNDTPPDALNLGAVPVTGLGSGVTEVAVGSVYACALVAGDIRCWGLNTAGELGNGGAVDAFLPVPVPGFP